MQSFMLLERKCGLAKAPRLGGVVPETGLRSRRHHQHRSPGAPGQPKRHETPDPVRVLSP